MNFLDNVSPAWIETQYLLWKESPECLSPEWEAFFRGFELGNTPSPEGGTGDMPDSVARQAGVQSLVHRFRDIGHLLACTDPLSPCRTDHPLLRLDLFGLNEKDRDRVFGVDASPLKQATLSEILEMLRQTYCRSIGVEFMHIQDPEKWSWLVERMEASRNRTKLSSEDKAGILRLLREATWFDQFLHRKFPGQTRFSLQGGETLIPMLDALLSRAPDAGITDILLGMPHRGRLNIQAHIFGKPFENIFDEFRDTGEAGCIGDGDVKYHGGVSTDIRVPSGKTIHLTLAANPSHLEAIDPVLEGKCRARQDRLGDGGAQRVLPVLIHGDAAFAGQGIVAETLNLAGLEGYGTGGTLHLVVNNQIGFTTLPGDARSTRYATDVAKMLMAPIFHVHCEDPEAAVHCILLALDYRHRFSCDVVVELICYRRFGHNEGDEPYFTQPLMYRKIKERPPVYETYGMGLRDEGITPEDADEARQAFTRRLEAALELEPSRRFPGFLGRWSGFRQEYSPAKTETGLSREVLVSLADSLAVLPPDFTPHPKIAALITRRREAVAAGEGLDWATAESLAFASLLREGTSVRISGQDSRRGTFSQRHCVLYDISTEAAWIPLGAIATGGAAFRAFDSPLSEAAVLGFEYGYSLESPESLTVWEAQYGDFANGAQVVIDQFITSGETKWGRASGLTMLLPHGYEGHGAEHSSSRVERYLQLCADNNIQIAYPSTPAQYFHLLRRQVRQPFRKPLVVLTPKSLLRNPDCVSRLDEFVGGWFREVLSSTADPEKVTTVLICSGKLYFELAARRERDSRDDVAIVRIEQLYPLRLDLLREELGRYRRARRHVWAQEEPGNMGPWSFLRPRLSEILGREPFFAGRREDACPAVGSLHQHRIEQEGILELAFAE